jgi:isocitrate dehydrogenase
MTKTAVTVARGDGIGPEITDAALRILDAAQAQLAIEFVDVGERIYREGHTTGIPPEAWESLRRTGLLLKGPITTPQGGGVNSLNVTIRTTLGLFANVRPVRSYAPFVATNHPTMDLVIIRENEEDLYAGIEYQQTDEVAQCLKLISRPGSERIIRFAFEYARCRERRKVTCMTKDNIMKLTDGLFHRVFDEVAAEYPDIESDHYIIDIGMARVAAQPERFEVVVLPNLYGDIISDVAAEVSGSVGLAGSSNIGERCAMFEAIHGSAPDIAGRGVANPSGIIQAATMLLAHIGHGDSAQSIRNAWLTTIEDGIHTMDIYREDRSSRLVGTREFADAVVERLGQEPRRLRAVRYAPKPVVILPPKRSVRARKDLLGVDVFVHWTRGRAEDLATLLAEVAAPDLPLVTISNRGVKVWPEGFPDTFCTDHWRCRFEAKEGQTTTPAHVVTLLDRMNGAGVEFIKTEHLYAFEGKPAFSRGQ